MVAKNKVFVMQVFRPELHPESPVLKRASVGEIAQGLRAMAALLETPGSVSSTHMAAHDCCITPAPGGCTGLLPMDCVHIMYRWTSMH